MAVYRQKGSKMWWYEFTFEGNRIRRSSKTTSKKLAQEAEKQCRRRMEESYNGLKRHKPMLEFSQAAEEYLAAKTSKVEPSTVRIESYNVRHLLPTFKGQSLVCIVGISYTCLPEIRCRRSRVPHHRRAGFTAT